MVKAVLLLQDGSSFFGESFGAETDAVFELVFNTSMTGYQEIITDPSYRGQGVLFTVPHIGNVGINHEDNESEQPQVSAILVRSISPMVSNWRSTISLSEWLKEHNVPGISGIDTRMITRKIRDHGTMKAVLSTKGSTLSFLESVLEQWQGIDGVDLVSEVTCKEPYLWEGDKTSAWVMEDIQRFNKPSNHRKPRVLVYDFGLKKNMLRHLHEWGCDVIVCPANTPSKEAFEIEPDGILLTNGPGDPAALTHIIPIVKELLEGNVPIFGICLGHQLIGLALGGQTERLKFGHHGGNHPVMDLITKKTLVTSQNHNFVVNIQSIQRHNTEITHVSLNDGSLEGMQLSDRPVFSVQYHPEAAPGPHDGHNLFQKFLEVVNNG